MTLATRLEAEGNALVATLGEARRERELLRAELADRDALLFETEMVHRRAIAAARKGSRVRHLAPVDEGAAPVSKVRDGAEPRRVVDEEAVARAAKLATAKLQWPPELPRKEWFPKDEPKPAEKRERVCRGCGALADRPCAPRCAYRSERGYPAEPTVERGA